MKNTSLICLGLLFATVCHAQIGLKEIEKRVGATGLSESLTKRMTSPYTISVEGLPIVDPSEWNQHAKEMHDQNSPLKTFTIGSGDSDSPEARSFSVYVSVELRQYWLLPHSPENPKNLVYGPVQIHAPKEEIKSEQGNPITRP